MNCVFCSHEIVVEDRVFRTESCPHCHRDLHCCLQCRFYDPSAHHECRESSAEFVSDKERANFCDYFVFDLQMKTNIQKEAEEARAKLDALFKK